MRLVCLGLKVLYLRMQLHHVVFLYNMSRFLLVPGNIFNLSSWWCFPCLCCWWCFPCLCFWSVLMGRSCPRFSEMFWHQASILSYWWSLPHCLTPWRHSDDHRGAWCTRPVLYFFSVYLFSVPLGKLIQAADVDCSDPALVCTYSTISSTAGCCEGFGPTGATDGQG